MRGSPIHVEHVGDEIAPMGSDGNAAIVRRGYEAFNKADIATLTKLFDEKASWHTPGRSPIAGDRKGRDAVFTQVGPLWRGDRRDLPGQFAERA